PLAIFSHAPPTNQIYTLSLHDALPIYRTAVQRRPFTGEGGPMRADDMILVSVDDHLVEPPDLFEGRLPARYADLAPRVERTRDRSEEHTSELQSRENLVCRLLLETKKT